MEIRKVAIIEDTEFYRNGFLTILRSVDRYSVVGVYETCEDFLKAVNVSNPDIVLVDIELPGMSGIDGIECIKKAKPSIDIIVFTIHESHELILKAIKAGAIGYLSKNSPDYFFEVITAFDSLRRGGAPLSNSIAKALVTSMHKNADSPLTVREVSILENLAKGKTYSVIADDLFISKFTVRTHMRNIYRKLNVQNKADAINLARNSRIIV